MRLNERHKDDKKSLTPYHTIPCLAIAIGAFETFAAASTLMNKLLFEGNSFPWIRPPLSSLLRCRSFCMVWYNMVWYGMVWYIAYRVWLLPFDFKLVSTWLQQGWNTVEPYSRPLHHLVHHNLYMVLYGMVWYDMVWYEILLTFSHRRINSTRATI